MQPLIHNTQLAGPLPIYNNKLAVDKVYGDFQSINAALASIPTIGPLAPSSSNMYIIEVGPGVYIEDPITLKSFVMLRSIGSDINTVIQPNTLNVLFPATPLITAQSASAIDGFTLRASAAPNGFAGMTALYYTPTINNIGSTFRPRNLRFLFNEIDFHIVGNAFPTYVRSHTLYFVIADNSTITNLRCENPLGVEAATLFESVGVTNISGANTTNLSESILVTGPNNRTVINGLNMQTTAGLVNAMGDGVVCQDGALLEINAGDISGFDINVRTRNIGAGPEIRIAGDVSTSSTTRDISIEHPGTIGLFSGAATKTKVFIDPISTVSANYSDVSVSGGTVIVGPISMGPKHDDITDFTQLFNEALPTGVISGGDLSGGLSYQDVTFSTSKTGTSTTGLNTPGYQVVNVGGAHIGADATGLVPATTYTATVAIDGGAGPLTKNISILGSNAQTFTTLISEIQLDLDVGGIDANVALVGGNIKITSLTRSSTSSVAITAGTLFAAPLAGFVSVNAAVPGTTLTYTATITVDGTPHAISLSGDNAHTYTTLLSEINTDLGVFATATLFGGNIRVTSSTTGLAGSVSIADSGANLLFSSLTDFTSIATAIHHPLHTTISAGYGYVGVQNVNLHMRNLSWNTTELLLPDNSNVYVYVNSTGTLTSNIAPPDRVANIILGRILTMGGEIVTVLKIPQLISHVASALDQFARDAFGPIYKVGSLVTENVTPLHLDISSGQYFLSQLEFNPAGGSNHSFFPWYAVDSTFIRAASTNAVSNTQYNNTAEGIQDVLITLAKTGASSTGLANNATVYTASVVVDGVTKPISITGSAAQTYTTLLSEINTDLGASATASLLVTAYQDVIFSVGKRGTDSTSLVGATTYTATIVVDGVSKPISILGSSAPVFSQLIDQLNSVSNLGSSATAVLHGTYIRITSNTTGASSSVSITAGTLFAAPLASFSSIGTAIGSSLRITSNSLTNISSIAITDTNLFSTLTNYNSIAAAINGGLVSLSTGHYTKHSLYVSGAGIDEQYSLVYGQAQFQSDPAGLAAVLAAPLPSPPIGFTDNVAPIASIIVQQGTANIVQITSIRPIVGFQAPSLSGTIYHGSLLGLNDVDDHPGYLLVSGGRPSAGNLDMGGNNVTNVNLVDGTDVSTHAARHLPNGADAVATAAPLTNVSDVSTNGTGSANTLSRSDHTHAVSGLGILTNPLSQFAATTSAQLAGVLTDETGTGLAVFGTGPSISSPKVSTALIMDKTSGVGLKVDTTTPTYPYRDITGVMKTAGGASPTLSTFIGGSVRVYSFTTGDRCDIDFHIPHDYAPGTDLYIHYHWSHNGTSISGNIVATIAYTYAKGHNQTIFSTEKTQTFTYNTTNIATTPRYVHRLEELQLSTPGGSATLLDTSLIEPDGVISVDFTMTTRPTIAGGAPNDPFVFFIDLHYQSTGIGTKQKTPNFYV